MQLIETLRRQHRELEKSVGVLEAALAAGSLTDARRALNALKEALVAHLALEDRELYPALAGQTGSGASSVGQTFATNMKRISEGLIAFFQSAERSDVARLARDWSGIKPVLTSRIDSEEKVLYPLYVRTAAVREQHSA